MANNSTNTNKTNIQSHKFTLSYLTQIKDNDKG
jgi:hypothetical protein